VQEHGAVGVLAYRLSSYSRAEVNRDIAPMSSIPYDSVAASWGLLLSANARETLLGALAKGPVRVRVDVETRLYPSEELTLVAEVRGGVQPEERFAFSAHVQESGANDNATGVAALAEIARTLAQGVESGVFEPKRTITMIWGDEISSTRRFLEDDPVRAEGVRWGLSLDMVGEDTQKTGGTFLIEKMPDPSAVWTRGEDHHTEWGGRPLTTDQLTPHYLNDFVLNRCLDQAAGSDWVVKTNPYEGGSDHVPFLRSGTAGLLLWHFTDQFYHTDGDRLEMVSSNTLWNVGVCSAVSAMTLVTADAEISAYLIGEIERAAMARLETEAELSRAAIAAGGDPEEERLILESWTEWYLGALSTMIDLEPGGPTQETLDAIEAARANVAELGRHYGEAMVRS
jgi:aminopeptidase YwaD